MNGALSHGLPALTTSGDRIVKADTGADVVLRGINLSGLEYSEPGDQGFLAYSGFTQDLIRRIVTDWNSRIIRLPFTQDRVLRGRGSLTGEQYLIAIDQMIDWSASLGAYTLLDLQWLSSEYVFALDDKGNPIRIAPLPDTESPTLWRILAERYASESAVLFDIYNEPHDCSAADWRYWAALLADTIREVHPQSLLFVSGIDWGYDLRKVRIEADNIVYSTHVYRVKTEDPEEPFEDAPSKVPLFAAEWGGSDNDLEWGGVLADYLHENQIGWTAWSWHDNPKLQINDIPTKFGELVKAELIR